MADWKNPGDYPSEKEALGASLDLWAFCFLRRNKKFLNEFMEAKKLPHPKVDDTGQPVGWNQSPTGKVLKNWGVEWPCLPEWIENGLSDSPVRFQKHPVYARSVKIEGMRYKLMPESEFRVVLEFDLEAPLQAQLERAKKMLDASKNQIKEKLPADNRKQVAMYPLYLRVLDAMAAGATKAKIAEVFSLERPDGVTEKDIDNWKKAAEQLASEGYRQLAKLSR